MTDDRSLERAARAWLEDGPTRAPDRPIDSALARIQTTAQERGPLVPWRLPKMTSLTRVAVGGAIAVAVLLAASTLLPRVPGSGGQSSDRPSPIATPQPTGPVSPTSGPRPAGLGTVPPYVPDTALPAPAGAPLPDSLLNRTYTVEPLDPLGSQELILTLRAADDPHCTALFAGGSTCFTVLWEPNYPNHQTDPGARGSARIVGERLVLSFDVIPNDVVCEGSVATYRIDAGGDTLVGLDPPACTFAGFAST